MMIIKWGSGSIMLKFSAVLLLFFLLSFAAKAQPVVIGHPADTAVCIGGKAVFYVLAVNAIGYQWQENDGVGWYNIDASITYASGYTTQVLTINDANLGLDGYRYRCLAFDGQNNSVVSNPATLGVNEPPLITAHPTDITVCKNDIALFEVGVLNADRFQWQESVGQGWINLTDNAFYMGTNSPTLQIFTTTGMNGFRYRCRVINGNCPDTTASSFLFVNPTPTLQEVLGGGAYCEGGQGVNISLAGSESGISYHLQRNGSGTGIVVSGTGEAINFGMFTQAGTYGVLAINGATSCEIPMLNSVQVVVNPLPLQQPLLGGGGYCAGSEAPEIFLASTQQLVEYRLLRNGVETGLIITGNGFSQSFGSIEETGFYTVIAQNVSSGCGTQLAANVQVLRNELPIVESGVNQTINIGETVQLSATASAGSGNYQYNWQPAALLIQPQQANTSSIPLYQSQLFKVTAKDQVSSCQSVADSLMVYVSGGSLSTDIIVDQTVLCKGAQTSLRASASGGSGVYTYVWTSEPPGFTATTEQINVSPDQTTTYQLTVNDGTNNASNSVSITVKATPLSYNLVGGGAYCQGSTGLEISLTGSQTGHLYQLTRDNIVVATKDGTGQPIVFGNYSTAGNYQAQAISLVSGCSNLMEGTAVVSVQERPLAFAGNNITIEAGETTTLQGSASGGTGNYSYSWTPADKLINPNSAIAASIPLEATQLFRLQVTDQTSSCVSLPAEVIVFVSGGSNLSMSVSASNYNPCPGTEIQLSVLASGGTGNYTYSWTSIPEGFTSELFNPVVVPQQTTKYRIMVNDGLTQRTDSLTITLRAAPFAYSISGGGDYCAGDEGKEIKLSGSQTSTIYNLLRDGEETGVIRSGNGDGLTFGLQTEEGIYQIHALSLTSLCSTLMNGTAAIEIAPLPQASSIPDQMIQAGQTATISGAAEGGSGNYSFQWQPAGKVINPNSSQTVTIPLNQTQEFHFFATDLQSNCTSNPASTAVIVQGSPLEVSALADDFEICEGNNVQLYANPSGGSGNYTYSWTSNPPGFFATTANPVVSPSATTIYTVQVNDGISTATNVLEIVVSALPQSYTITGGGNVCYTGETVAIGIDGTQNGKQYSLLLNGEAIATVSGNGNAMSFGLFNQAGTYTAIGKDINSGCQATMNGAATVYSGGGIIANAGPDKYLAQTGQVSLEGSVYHQNTNYTFNWHPANKLINPQALQPTTELLNQTSLFKLQAVPQNSGCPPSEDFATVFVGNTVNPLQINIFSNDTSVCPGIQTQLFALVSGGTGNYSYNWSSSPQGFISDVFNPIVNPATTTIYTVSVTDGDLIASASFEVTVYNLPDLFQLNGGGDFCEGQTSAGIELSGSAINTIYKLYKDGLPTTYELTGTDQPIVFEQINQGGIYTVEAIQLGENCPVFMDGQAELVFNATPLALSSPNQSIPRGSSTVLNGTASGGSGSYTYQWTPEQFVANPVGATTLTLPLEQSVVFQFIATDQISGCSSLPDTTVIAVTGGIFSVSILASTTVVCTGGTVELLALTEGGSGTVSYMWKNEAGNTIGTNSSLVLEISESMTVFLEAQDDTQTAETSILIENLPDPVIFEFSGGGNSCNNTANFSFELSGSQNGVTYYLYNEGNLVFMQEGTGQALSFGPTSIPGSYHLQAAFTGTSCFVIMNGEAVISSSESPQITTGPMQSIAYGSTTILEVNVEGSAGNYTYQWQPESLLLTPNQPQTASVPLFNTSLFTVQVVDVLSGCSSSGQTTVFVSPQPNTISLELFSPDESICPSERARLFVLPSGGNGNYTYLWSSNPAGFASTIPDPEVFPEVTTTYTVLVSDGDQSSQASISIYVKPSPQAFDVFGGGSYCNGSEFANIVLAGSNQGTVYTLYRNDNPTNWIYNGTGAAIQFGPLSQSGNYTVVAKNNATQCSRPMIGSADVQLFNRPTVITGPDQQILTGQQTSLAAAVAGGSGSYTYHWQPEAVVHFPDSLQTQTMALQQSTVFLFTATDLVSACQSNADSTLVVVTGGPLSVAVAVSTNKICAGQEVSLTAIPQGGSGNYSYSWTDNNGNILGNTASLLIAPTTTVEITLTIQDGDQSATAASIIEVAAFPQVFSVEGGGSFCGENEGVAINLSSSETGVQYQLLRDYTQNLAQFEGTGGILDLGIYNTSGIYTVRAIRSAYNCQMMMAGSALVQQVQPPQVDAGVNQMIPFGTSTQLTPTVSGGSGNYGYNWQPAAALINPQLANPTTVNLTESKVFTLIVTDNNSNCQASDQTLVLVSGGNLQLSILAETTSLCSGGSTVLTAVAQGGTGNYSWQWRDQMNNAIGGSASIEVFPEQTTTYALTLQDGLTSITETVTINVAPAAVSHVVGGGGIWCAGGTMPSISLSGSQTAYVYRLYRNGNGTSFMANGTGEPLLFEGNFSNGTYTIAATGPNACTTFMEGSAMIQQASPPIQYTVFGGGTYCLNESFPGVYTSGSQQGVTYKLIKNFETVEATKEGTGAPIGFTNILESGIYTIQAELATSNCSNMMQGAAIYLINPVPSIDFSGASMICLGDTTTISASGANTYTWLTNPPQDGFSINVQPLEATDYILQATNIYQCTATDTFSIMVAPLPSFDIYNDPNQRIVTVENPENASLFRFSSGAFNLQESPSTVFNYNSLSFGNDSLAVTAISPFGCEATSYVLLTDEGIRINAFSPNSDLINDRFMRGSFIRLYNRWGIEIYSGDEGWDGRYKGMEVSPGTYYYIHEIRDLSGNLIRTEKGSVTLVKE